MKMTRLALNVLIIGDSFKKDDLDLIERVHGSVDEITIRSLTSFRGQNEMLDYIKASNSTIYVTSDVDQVLVDSIKKSGRHVGVLRGAETFWYNITGYGHFHSLEEVLAMKTQQNGAVTSG
jgi:hypothetical protein